MVKVQRGNTMTTENTTTEETVTLSEKVAKALIEALDAILRESKGVASALRDCFKELLPSLPWKDGKCALTGAKATKALPEVQSATKVINDMLLKHDRFTVEGEKADTVKLSDSIRSQINQAKSALGLPKRRINRTGKGNGGEANPTATEAKEIVPMSAEMMEEASWSPDVIRHTIAQCIIALCGTQAGKDAVTEHVNRALIEAGCGELAIVAKPKAVVPAVKKEDRKEMLKRLNEMQDLQDKLAAG
jgi:hypothetical protein